MSLVDLCFETDYDELYKRGNGFYTRCFVGMLNEVPFCAAMNKAITFKMGQTLVQKYLQPLIINRAGEIAPIFIITHRMKPDEAPKAFDMRSREEGQSWFG